MQNDELANQANGRHGLSRRHFLRRSAIALPFLSNLPSATELLGFDGEMQSSRDVQFRSSLNYHPEGLYVWDIWFFTRGDEVHLLHLQKKRPDSKRPDKDDGAIGHAVTTDLLNWKELPPALYKGPMGSIDDLDLFTGCAIEHEGKFYLFYTARSSVEKGLRQRTCLATSDDAVNWKKHPEPVIVPDERWYTQDDCRDLIIQQHPETREFHGFYAAGVSAKELVRKNVIAHVRSRDLIHWTHEAPAFVPISQAVVECPDVFFLGNRWWITCNAGHQYGARAKFSDPYVTWGTIYASSDHLEGPYREGSDNVLIGSMEFNGFCCRSAVWEGRRHLFYGQGERIGQIDQGNVTTGTLTTPKDLRASSPGMLRIIYSPIIEKRAGAELMRQPVSSQLIEVGDRFGTSGEWIASTSQLSANSPESWSARLCGTKTQSFLFSADVSLNRGRAIGLLFRERLAVLLDHQEQSITFTQLPELHRLDCRRVSLAHGSSNVLRLVAKSEFFEVYLNDELILNFVRYLPAKGRLGFYVEEGQGVFSNVRAVELT